MCLTLGGNFLLPAGSSGPVVPLCGSCMKCGIGLPFPTILQGRCSYPTSQKRNLRLREMKQVTGS